MIEALILCVCVTLFPASTSALVGSEKPRGLTLEKETPPKVFSRGFRKAKIPKELSALDLIGEKVRGGR